MQTFRAYLQDPCASEERIEQSLALIHQFEQFCGRPGQPPTTEATRAFVDYLMQERADTHENLVALAQFGRYSGNHDLYLEILGLLDGSEMLENLCDKVSCQYDDSLWQQICEGIDMPSPGADHRTRARVMGEVIARLEEAIGTAAVRHLLVDSLRDLPESWYEESKSRFEQTGDLQDVLDHQAEGFIGELERIQAAGGLYGNQVITDDVVRYVRENREIASGVRQAHRILVTRLPYRTREYLAETDPVRKRYYACRSSWARESILADQPVSATFCQSCAGSVKKGWETIVGRRLRCEVVESALAGEQRCRFAIYLSDPE